MLYRQCNEILVTWYLSLESKSAQSVFLRQRPAGDTLSQAIKKHWGWFLLVLFDITALLFEKMIHSQWELPEEQFREYSTNYWVLLVHVGFNRHKLSTPKPREKIHPIVNIRYFTTSPALCYAYLFACLIDLCRSDPVSAEQWKGDPASIAQLPSQIGWQGNRLTVLYNQV